MHKYSISHRSGRENKPSGQYFVFARPIYRMSVACRKPTFFNIGQHSRFTTSHILPASDESEFSIPRSKIYADIRERCTPDLFTTCPIYITFAACSPDTDISNIGKHSRFTTQFTTQNVLAKEDRTDQCSPFYCLDLRGRCIRGLYTICPIYIMCTA